MPTSALKSITRSLDKADFWLAEWNLFSRVKITSDAQCSVFQLLYYSTACQVQHCADFFAARYDFEEEALRSVQPGLVKRGIVQLPSKDYIARFSASAWPCSYSASSSTSQTRAVQYCGTALVPAFQLHIVVDQKAAREKLLRVPIAKP